MSVTEPTTAPGVPVDALAVAAGEEAEGTVDERRPQPDLADQMDALSLRQALIDFEVANARTRDLTQRLVKLAEENGRLEHELAELRAEIVAEREVWAQVKGSQAFRLASRIWNLRNALKG
jgi:predicted  nucleic acid-binding Zn-ribbon protein